MKYVNRGPSCRELFSEYKTGGFVVTLARAFQIILTQLGSGDLLMIFKINTMNLLMQFKAILELFSLLCLEGKKCNACPQISCGGDTALAARIPGLCICLLGWGQPVNLLQE